MKINLTRPQRDLIIDALARLEVDLEDEEDWRRLALMERTTDALFPGTVKRSTGSLHSPHDRHG